MKTETVRARIEPDLKRDVEQVLDQLGLSTTDAIRIYFNQIRLIQGLPFEIKLPNKETLEAIHYSEQTTHIHSYPNTEKLFDDLNT